MNRISFRGANLAVALLLLLSQPACQLVKPSINQAMCHKIAAAQQSTLTFDIVETDVERVKTKLFVSSDIHDQWQRSKSLSSQGWLGWSLVFKIINEKDGRSTLIQSPIFVDLERPLPALFLLQNNYKSSHPARIILLLNHQQVNIRQAGVVKPFVELDTMQPGMDAGFEMLIPALPKGFHQISVIPIADPENHSTDIYYRGDQQNSVHEYRYDLWNGIQPFDDAIPGFANEQTGLLSSVLFTSAELIHMPEQVQNQPLLVLDAVPDSDICVHLRFINVRPIRDAQYRYPVPVKIAVFWDDQLSQMLDYTLQPDMQEGFTLPLSVSVPKTPGRHLLQIAPLVLPGYSQFKSLDERTTRLLGPFTKRVVVTVRASGP